MPPYILGIDIGGTKISTGLVSPRGNIFLQKKSFTEVHKGKKHILENIYQAITPYSKSSYNCIGIGIMGSVDWKRGISRTSDKLPRDWKNVPLASLISKRFQKKVFIDNDVNAFTLGAALKEGGPCNNIIGITLGSGIGGGFVINKRIYHGANNWVTELGHTIIDVSSKDRCACGHWGHFEALAGGWGMERMYHQRTNKQKTTYEIEELVYQKNRAALAVYHIMTRALGAGLANIVAAYSPECILIGGGLSRMRKYVQDGQREMRKFLAGLPAHKTIIKHVHNPEASNIRGAAFLTDPKHHLY